MLALYHWHSYEFRALSLGLVAGLLIGARIGLSIATTLRNRRVRAAVARAQAPRSRA